MSGSPSSIDGTVEICLWGLWPGRLRQLTESCTRAAFEATLDQAIQDREKLSYFILYAQYGPEELKASECDQLMQLLNDFDPALSREDAFLTIGELTQPMSASRFEAAFDAYKDKADVFQAEVAEALDKGSGSAAVTVKGWISHSQDEEGGVDANDTAPFLHEWSRDLMSAFVSLGWNDTAFKDTVVNEHFEKSLQHAKEACKRFEFLESLEESDASE